VKQGFLGYAEEIYIIKGVKIKIILVIFLNFDF